MEKEKGGEGKLCLCKKERDTVWKDYIWKEF